MSYESTLKSNYAAAHKRLVTPEIKLAPKPKLVVVSVSPAKLRQRQFYQLSQQMLHGCPKMHHILRVVSELEGVEISRIISTRKQKSLVVSRQWFFFLSYFYTRNSLHQIGNVVGGKDHTTVLYGVRKIETYIEKKQHYQQRYVEYLERLRSVIPRLSPQSPTIASPTAFYCTQWIHRIV